jgi:hypothetical protein
VLHRGEIVLADANGFGQLRLHHIESVPDHSSARRT